MKSQTLTLPAIAELGVSSFGWTIDCDGLAAAAEEYEANDGGETVDIFFLIW